ncbi:MAG: PH domain-containing protein [Alphaproteobacteria bacterium]|nr:PH domain-containing protein [Alphaproteobacteria bacterium]
MPQNKTPAPLLRLRSRFDPLMQLWRHPVRLTVSLLLIIFLLPEAAALGSRFLGFGAALSYLLSTAMVLLLVIAPQFFVAYINCRHVCYDFHADHLSFTENVLLRDVIRVPYRTIAGVYARRSALQKRAGLGDIVIESRPARHLGLRGVDHVIEDIPAAGKQKAKIEKIIAAWREAQTPSAETAAAGDTDKR